MDQIEFFSTYGSVQLQFAGFVHAPPFSVEEFFQAIKQRLEQGDFGEHVAAPSGFDDVKRTRGRPRGSKNGLKPEGENSHSSQDDSAQDDEADDPLGQAVPTVQDGIDDSGANQDEARPDLT